MGYAHSIYQLVLIRYDINPVRDLYRVGVGSLEFEGAGVELVISTLLGDQLVAFQLRDPKRDILHGLHLLSGVFSIHLNKVKVKINNIKLRY